MAIETNNLVIYKSERLTDTSDGGGKYSGQVVEDGISNNLFNDVSELDRTMGDVSMRKVFPGVTSADTDALMGATVFISENPVDPNVSALLFSTSSHTDTRNAAQNRLENYLAKGGVATGTPLDTHWQGMKLLQVVMFPKETESAVGDTLVLISNEGKANQVEQYLRITKVETRIAIMVIDGKDVEYKIATYSLNDALRSDFVGLTARQWYNGNVSTSIIRETLVADTGKYYASVGIRNDVAVASTTIQAKSIFTQLVPASQVETPLLDLSITGTATAMIGASGTITRQITTTVGANNSTYIGSSILPSSVSFTLDNNQVTDNAGELKTVSGNSVGTINYDTGLIRWGAGSGSGSKTINVTFTPIAKRDRVSNSDSVEVTQNSQSLNFVRTILPVPARGSFVLNFTAQGKTYTVTDNGSGVISGAVTGIATGTVDYVTGTVLVTFSALPDVGSAIVWYWADSVASEDITSKQATRLAIDYTLSQTLDLTQPATITWKVDNVDKSAAVATDGSISGDATGAVNGNKITFQPGILFPLSNLLTVTYNQFTGGNSQTGPYSLTDLGETETINGENFKRYGFGIGADSDVNTLKFTLVMSSTKAGLEFSYSTSEKILTNNVFNFQSYGSDIYLMIENKQVRKVGSINFTTGEVVFTAYAVRDAYQRVVKTSGGYYNIQTTSVERVSMPFTITDPTQLVQCTLGKEATSIAASEQPVRSTGYYVDIAKNAGMVVAPESVFFQIAGKNYYLSGASVYTGFNSNTGTGTTVGNFNPSSGRLDLSTFSDSGSNTIVWQSIIQVADNMPVASAVFKIPIAPVRPLSFQLLVGTPVTINVTADESGNITHERVKGTIDYQTGVVRLSFYTINQNVTIPELNAMKALRPWLNEDFYTLNVDGSGTYIVNMPYWYSTDDIRYNAVGYSYIPLDADILGLSATRLPLDGRVPIFRVGDIGIISSSKSQTLDSAVAGSIHQLDDARISYCELEDQNGIKVSYDQYVVDYDYGKVTLSGDFAVGSLVTPLIAKYRYQDMGLINDVQIDGRITFTKPVTHNYDAETSVVGSALVIGDMQSRYTSKFVQGTWNNIWDDVPSGGAISANYNDALYAIKITNKGAIQERWAIVFTDTTTFRCIGEVSGQIATGAINTDFAPINPTTGLPYFTIKKEGWGSGWANGNVLRFNTIACMFPIWCIRCVKQSEPTVLSDQFQIMLRGDIDRVI
ncbi:hypothetical protein ACG94O_05765 [Acinetobacter ursingii]|uniref:hypothetical protein n=1 Tax=Acinetobacter ursingii TaxID=108980 RepID=UPI003AF9AC5A